MAAAHRWGQRKFIAPPTLSRIKKYCWVRLILFAGATPANQQHSNSVELANRQPPVNWSLCRGTTPADSCLVIWDTTAVVATMPTLWNAGVHAYTHANLQQWWPAACCMALADSYCCCCLYLYAAHSKTSHSARASCGFSVKITLSWPLRRALQIRSRSIDRYGRP